MEKRKTVGIDLAKNSFYFVVLNEHGKRVVRKKLNRRQVLPYLVNHESCVVAMEACSSAHYWGREIQKLGHEVQLLPPQHVKGYLRGQKNDYNDAQAIAEASQHGAIRSVAIKTIEQQDEQSILHMRRLLNVERTRLINHIRGLLGEYGIVVIKSAAAIRKEIPLILEDADNPLTDIFRKFIHRQYLRLLDIEEELKLYQHYVESTVKTDDTCQRLISMPGIGPIVSISLKAWMGDGQQFKRGRDASAALGLVPRQHSTGGKTVLLGISKRGNSHLRSLVVNGARAVVTQALLRN
ncbi:IS110 family transposase [Vibrio splendidus]|uniref:IS110 family transposase n=2 Tax=Vibrio TaxID=662 RepID=A0AA43G7C8_VIBSP|nr:MULTISPECIES: IS110 family transposase [Vibrio]MDH5924470.1 IS110 family transposase [Vibrio splendidus]MDH5953180.1 IS110 family transposase [Vibrio crassostreae]TCM98371.1 transposase [Vibrio crassostreae]CAK3013168.1 transposase [Vibrio crassostreae]CAK3640575.1 transposase [Vibrio crassostreae]